MAQPEGNGAAQRLANQLRTPSVKIELLTDTSPQSWTGWQLKFEDAAMFMNWNNWAQKYRSRASLANEILEKVADLTTADPITAQQLLDSYKQGLVEANGEISAANTRRKGVLPSMTKVESKVR